MLKNTILATAAIALFATSASAQGIPDPTPNPPNADEGAVIYRLDNTCTVTFDGQQFNGDIFYVDSNAQGATRPAILICKGEADIGNDRPVVLQGYQCFTPFGVTTDSRRLLSTSGKWTSVCKFRD